MMRAARRLGSYKVNASAMADLRADGVPDAVLSRLEELVDVEFGSRRAFDSALRERLGPEAFAAHGRAVAGKARVLTPRRLVRYLASVGGGYVPASRHVPALWDYLRLRPVPFALWFRTRARLLYLRNRLGAGSVVRERTNSNVSGFQHNRSQVLSFLEGHRSRTESLIQVLRAVHGFRPADARVLCVGPRNEAEVMLFWLYGFRPENVAAVDLFSYSPRIHLMDMNDLEFPDDSFDVYYSSAVIRYSPDIRRTCAEAVRVTRDGGLIVIGSTFGTHSGLIPEGSELRGGLRELLALFAGHVRHVYWQEEAPSGPGEMYAATIFRVVKP
ncbi:MAG TPA: methyltransferase domain-containing protein [Longimicrobiaceae bacterium]|nr:methyltransferase domain-containing protein [Longimicrobiaceae bacterium]